jgi:hypothetical protein
MSLGTIIRTYRDAIRDISPPWLRKGNAEKLGYSLGVVVDDFAEALNASIRIRFPGVYSTESLPLIGRERRIRRGRTETDAVYASRLTRWLTDHRRRGGPYAMLAQVFAHYAPNNFNIELIYRSGRQFAMDTAGAVVRSDISWSPDSTPSLWAHWWLIYHWPDPVAASGTWDDEPTTVWDDTATVWDSDLSPQDVEDIRLVPKEWNAAHCIGTIRLIDSSSNQIQFQIGND